MERDAPTGGSAADVVGAPSGGREQRWAVGTELPPMPPTNTSRWGHSRASLPQPCEHSPEQVACSLTPGTHSSIPEVRQTRAAPHLSAQNARRCPESSAQHRFLAQGPSQTRPCRRLPADRRPQLPPTRRVRVATPNSFPSNQARRASLQAALPLKTSSRTARRLADVDARWPPWLAEIEGLGRLSLSPSRPGS